MTTGPRDVSLVSLVPLVSGPAACCDDEAAEAAREYVAGAAAAGVEIRLSATLPTETLRGYAPDANWRYVDRAGHEHVYAQGGDENDHYPTLARKTVHHSCSDPDCGCDGWDSTAFACRECGESVVPGTALVVAHVAACPLEYRLDGMPVTKAVYAAAEAVLLGQKGGDDAACGTAGANPPPDVL